MSVKKSVRTNKNFSVFLGVLCGGKKFFALAPCLIMGLFLVACGDDGARTRVTPETGEPTNEIVKVGRAAPEFEATDYKGQPIKLSDFKGKPVLLNFWATWCAPCQYEMPELKAAYARYQAQDLVIVGVNLNEPDATVKKFLEEKGYSWPNLPDPKGAIKNGYKIIGYPTSIFIDREGIVRATQIGGMEREMLAEKLGKIL